MDDIYIQRRITKVKSLDKIKLKNNQVLLKPITDNLNSTTPAGVYKSSVTLWKNQMLSGYVNRQFEVIAVCDKLTFWSRSNKTSESALRYKCDLEVEVGDIVWAGYNVSVDYDAVVVDDEVYTLTNYAELRMAQKPSGEYVLLSGWVLYVCPEISRSSILIDPNPKLDYTKGVVLMSGKKNSAYVMQNRYWKDLDGDMELNPGDVFLKSTPEHLLILENPVYATFTTPRCYLIQRKDIVAKL